MWTAGSLSRLDGEVELQTRSLKRRFRSTAIALPELKRQSIRGSLFEAAPGQQIGDLFAGWFAKSDVDLPIYGICSRTPRRFVFPPAFRVPDVCFFRTFVEILSGNGRTVWRDSRPLVV
jgi:hypothetical protein